MGMSNATVQTPYAQDFHTRPLHVLVTEQWVAEIPVKEGF